MQNKILPDHVSICGNNQRCLCKFIYIRFTDLKQRILTYKNKTDQTTYASTHFGVPTNKE